MNLKRHVNFRYVFYPFLAFLFGISVARGLYSADIETFLVVIAILFGFGILFVYKKKYKIMVLLFAFFFIGNGFFFLGSLKYSVEAYQGEVSIVGRVTDNFEESNYYYVVVLDDVKINGESAKNIKANFTKGNKSIKVGDILTFESEVTVQPLFTLGALNTNTYRQNVGYTLSANTSDLIVATGYTKFDENVRMSIKELIYENMSEENASIAYAVLFGDQSGISFEVNQSYRNSGIIHIIAVSGFNVAFLIAIIYTVLKRAKVKRSVSFTITCIVILLYAYFCGFAPSVVRASIMGIVIMTAKLFGRRYDALNSLGVAGFIILLLDPLTAFDSGFLMSVACVCGIVFLYPLFYKILRKCINYKIASYIATSLSAQLVILPFLASFGSSMNLLSFVINLLVVPLFGIMYPYLFFLSFISLLLPFLGILLTPVDWLLTVCYYIAYIFSSTSLQFKLYPLNLATKTIFFLIIFAVSKYVSVKPLTKFLSFAVLTMLCICSFGVFSVSININSSILYLYSYGEESVLLTSKNGQTLLVGDNYLLSRAMNNYHIEKLDTYLSFDSLNENDIDQLEDYGISYLFSTDGDKFQDQIVIVEKNQNTKVGDFNFTYLAVEDNVFGLIISFDDVQVFVANNEEFDYNNSIAYSLLLDNFNVDIAFLGENYNFASTKYLSVSCVQNPRTTFNYIKDGNMLFSSKNDLYARSID